MWQAEAMKAIMVRALTPEELKTLKEGLHTTDAFTLRRCQILLASRQGKTPRQIARELHCSDQCVREAIHAFHAQGLGCLQANSHATHTRQVSLDDAGLERLRELLHQSPRHFGQDRSLWTQETLAQVCSAQGITPRKVSRETIRRALVQLGENWRRARKRLTSPDPSYAPKNGPGPAGPPAPGSS